MSKEYDPATTTQPMPTKNNGKYIQDLVIEDIIKRKEHGIKKYKTGLQSANGRDALQDAYEECLDQAQYLKQLIVERDEQSTENGKFLAKIQSGEIKDG